MTKIILISFLLLPFLLIALLIWKVKRRRKKEAIAIAAGEFNILPFWKTIKESYRLAWRNRTEYLKISWVWLTISAVVVFLFNWLFWQKISIMSCMDMTQGKLDFSAFITSFLLNLIVVMCGASIAVAWHRFILRSERVTSSHYLRFDKVVWSYFILAALMLFVQTVPQLIILFINSGKELPLSAVMITLIVPIFNIVIIIYSVRIVIMLPAIALELPDVKIRDVLQKTRGNFWRLFFAPVVCSLPIMSFAPVYFFFIKELCKNNIAGPLFNTVYVLLVMIIIAPVYLSFLSLTYKYFFEKDVD